MSLAIYGFFAGVYAIVVGVRIINLGLTLLPFASGLGFILAGLGGVCASPMLYFSESKLFRLVLRQFYFEGKIPTGFSPHFLFDRVLVGAILLVIAALIFAWIT